MRFRNSLKSSNEWRSYAAKENGHLQLCRWSSFRQDQRHNGTICLKSWFGFTRSAKMKGLPGNFTQRKSAAGSPNTTQQKQPMKPNLSPKRIWRRRQEKRVLRLQRWSGIIGKKLKRWLNLVVRLVIFLKRKNFLFESGFLYLGWANIRLKMV